MKTAIYIEDGVVQVVITPETEFEKSALRPFGVDQAIPAKILRGAFYDCRGGWVRQKPQYNMNRLSGMDNNDGDNSLILRLDKPEPMVKREGVDPTKNIGGTAP